MVEQLGLARVNERDVIDDSCRVRKQITDPGAALAVTFEFTSSAEQLRAVAAAHEGKTFSLNERLWNWLAVQFNELRLVIKQLQLARSARHEQIDDVFRARCEVR